jgi:hypothetical protein
MDDRLFDATVMETVGDISFWIIQQRPSWEVISNSSGQKIAPTFISIEPETSVLCSQDFDTGTNPELDESVLTLIKILHEFLIVPNST